MRGSAGSLERRRRRLFGDGIEEAPAPQLAEGDQGQHAPAEREEVQQVGDHADLAAQQREVLIYTIGLLAEETRRDANEARHALDAITRATGGEAHYPKELDEVGPVALQVARDIRSQYIIGYTPSNQKLDGGFRQIRVTASGPNRPVVRTRTGYWATPEQGGRPPATPPARKKK